MSLTSWSNSSTAPLEVWVAYPSRKQLWVYTPEGRYAAHSGVFASALLDGATIDLGGVLA
jgi:hypothetical protein